MESVMRCLAIVSLLCFANLSFAQWGTKVTVQLGSNCPPPAQSFSILPPTVQAWAPAPQQFVIEQRPTIVLRQAPVWPAAVYYAPAPVVQLRQGSRFPTPVRDFFFGR